MGIGMGIVVTICAAIMLFAYIRGKRQCEKTEDAPIVMAMSLGIAAGVVLIILSSYYFSTITPKSGDICEEIRKESIAGKEVTEIAECRKH